MVMPVPAVAVGGAVIVTVGAVVSAACTIDTFALAVAWLLDPSIAWAVKTMDEPTAVPAGMAKGASNGGAVSVANVAPLAASSTVATPALSDAVAPTCSTLPGAAWVGTFTVTIGFVVSGSATMVRVADAVLLLPAASSAFTPTVRLVPGAANVGNGDQALVRRRRDLDRIRAVDLEGDRRDADVVGGVGQHHDLRPGSASFGPDTVTTGGA